MKCGIRRNPRIRTPTIGMPHSRLIVTVSSKVVIMG
jgi:hypothetical protein